MRELKLESQAYQLAKSKGYLLFKLTGYKGIPDRMLITDKEVVFIEFKTKSSLSKAQKVMAEKLKTLNQTIVVIKTLQEFSLLVTGQDLCSS